jgi:hypothetical protein
MADAVPTTPNIGAISVPESEQAYSVGNSTDPVCSRCQPNQLLISNLGR